MKISIFTSLSNKTNDIKSLVLNECYKRGYIIDDNNPDVIFYIGGDGTFLKAVQNNIDRLDSVKFIGINSGTLGYFYDAMIEDIEDIFVRLENNALIETKVPLLMGNAIKNDENIEFYAVNEIQIISSISSLRTNVSINEQFFEKYVGTGLIVSSAYGSSGVNKSFNGPVVKNGLDCLLLTPIGPISNNVYCSFTSSLVISKNDVIEISGGLSNATICFDNDKLEDTYDCLKITTSSSYVKVLFREKRDGLYPLRKSFL